MSGTASGIGADETAAAGQQPSASEQQATESSAAAASFLLNQPVVIDNGSSTIKAGFAGTSKPKVSLQTMTTCEIRRR